MLEKVRTKEKTYFPWSGLPDKKYLCLFYLFYEIILHKINKLFVIEIIKDGKVMHTYHSRKGLAL